MFDLDNNFVKTELCDFPLTTVVLDVLPKSSPFYIHFVAIRLVDIYAGVLE